MTTVVFDVGNVLLRWDARRVYRDVLDTDAEIDAFFDRVNFVAWNLAQDAGRSWADGVAEASANHPQDAALIQRFDREWHLSIPGPIEGSVDVLATLKEAGVPLYAITNFSAEKWAECQTRFPFLADSFLGVVVSAHEKLVKPDPAIFMLFLDRYGQRAEDCIFIDDSPANIASAQALGFDALLFDTAPALAADLRARGLPV
ncbi:MAG: HAD family phosphatase [Pseudomonadota bacterium]